MFFHQSEKKGTPVLSFSVYRCHPLHLCIRRNLFLGLCLNHFTADCVSPAWSNQHGRGPCTHPHPGILLDTASWEGGRGTEPK